MSEVTTILEDAQKKAQPRSELTSLAMLALPLVMTQIAQMATSTTDTLLIGRLGAPELAAAVIAGTYQFMGWMLGLGPMSAIGPIIAQKLGADPTNTSDVRSALRMALWAIALIALPLGLFYAAAPLLLGALGQPPEVVRLAVPYLWTVAPSVVFSMGYLALRNCLAALSFARAPLVIACILVGLNFVLAYGLVFGHFGMPRIGFLGAGIATAASNAVSFFLLLGWMSFWPTFKRFRFAERWWEADWPKLGELFRLGLPIGLTTFFEVTLFQVGVFLMGHIGTEALAAHTIAMNVASLTFMVPFGLAQAATVRVALAAGAGDRARARLAALNAIGLGAVFVLACAVLMLALPRQIAALYLGSAQGMSPAVVKHVVAFLAFAAAFQVFDSSQTIAAGALRGLKDTRVPLLLACASYWLIGMPVSVGLGFATPLGGEGIWAGFVVALAAAAILLVRRVLRLTSSGAEPCAPELSPAPEPLDLESRAEAA